MQHAAHALESPQMEMLGQPSGVLLRTIVIGLTAFLTVVDLFATQAILPSLTRAYGVSPAAMGSAVNAHARHGDRRALCRDLQQEDRSPARHPDQPGGPGDPDRAARERA